MKPTIGRIVLVTIGTEHGEAVTRPALVVRVWSDDCVNLLLFLDGGNDDRHVSNLGGAHPFAERGNAPVWLTSSLMGDGVGQWSWPPRV